MTIRGDFLVVANAQQVWTFLNNPRAVGSCLPGCDAVEVQDAQHARAMCEMHLGPIVARFLCSVTITGLEPPRRLQGVVDGYDASIRSGFKATGTLTLEPTAPNVTRVTYDVDVQIRGRIVPFADRLLPFVAKRLAGEFGENVSRTLKERAA
ncbi:MAG: SRPBCC domain-containing protein [Abditibacteriales bacterium]|nr:SRPBCC domain-containing protein [Abditibacteriales bacterium]MDW8366577.1 SRPBCC domain-containing protein [Abditibacteriales bacterium]